MKKTLAVILFNIILGLILLSGSTVLAASLINVKDTAADGSGMKGESCEEWLERTGLTYERIGVGYCAKDEIVIQDACIYSWIGLGIQPSSFKDPDGYPLAEASFIGWPDGKMCTKIQTEAAPPSKQEIIKIENPLIATSFEAIIGNIIDFIFKIAIVLAPLMVVVGGFLFVTAGGSVEKINRAKNLIIWTAIGFLIVLLSKGIIAIINQILGVRGE
jgi:hypothetical protein